jgi:hypothetical protein
MVSPWMRVHGFASALTSAERRSSAGHRSDGGTEVARARHPTTAQAIALTFIVHASRGETVVITVRLRVAAAIAKARVLSDAGWNVYIISPDDIRYSPAEFDRLLACSAF